MTAPPLTHHDILGLVEPFARAGWHVDLAASDRSARRIAFKPQDAGPGLVARMQLEMLSGGHGTIKRTLERADGLQATVQASGTDFGKLLALAQAVPTEALFGDGPGWALARGLSLDQAAAPGGPPMFVRGTARLDGLTLTMEVLPVKGVAAHVELRTDAGVSLDLPEDVLAVLGWDWTRLEPNFGGGWSTRRRLRGGIARRAATAGACLDLAAAHLARVLAEPPARYHRRFYFRRWGAMLRRAIPSLTAVAMIGGAFALARHASEQEARLWLALHYVPILLLGLAFTAQEMPRFEIPPLPRRRNAPSWRSTPAGRAATAQDEDACTATR